MFCIGQRFYPTFRYRSQDRIKSLKSKIYFYSYQMHDFSRPYSSMGKCVYWSWHKSYVEDIFGLSKKNATLKIG